MSHALKELEENSPDVYFEVTDTLLKIIDNVLTYPQNPRFRTLKLGNNIVSNKFIPSIGAMECLFQLGFEEVDNRLILPETVSLKKLRDFKHLIISRRSKFHRRFKKKFASSYEAKSMEFMDQIRTMSRAILCYEDKKLQALAREKMPLDELKRRRDNHLRTSNSLYDMEFSLFFELIIWFKTEFFKWMNHPTCEKCKCSSIFKGYSTIQEELVGTSRVEVYICEKCQDRILFPRYNNPATLLETRTGRCGEWANCFTLFCRTIGLEARYVLDKTDHVWTEVYSQTLKRWVHCDPCEGAIDTPLMYEKGWNKKLSYVLAFSKDEVQDVTWRYTTEFAEVRNRRIICDENDLLQLLTKLTEDLQKSLSYEQKKFLTKRRVLECVEFLTPPHTDKQFGGRISGSLAWRLSRGETRGEPISMIWKPTEAELECKQFRISYCTTTDKYYRDGSNEIINGWDNGVYEMNSVFRKVEHDWKVCYLSRSENSNTGIVKWKFCAKDTEYFIDTVKVTQSTQEFDTGCVRWTLCTEKTCIPIKNGINHFITTAFRYSKDITLTATLSGGTGNTAWQHAQIFRQSMDNADCPFEFTITLKSR